MIQWHAGLNQLSITHYRSLLLYLLALICNVAMDCHSHLMTMFIRVVLIFQSLEFLCCSSWNCCGYSREFTR